jgi:hypothetical protein
MASEGNYPTWSGLPDAFCWTKFGAEAGELPLSIFQRKELERCRNGGLFLWGIGQSIGPSLPELLRVTSEPEVLFSPIRTPAAVRDASPTQVVVWCDAIGHDGRRFRIPEHSLVTSRVDPARPRSGHYALVCEAESPILGLEDEDHYLAPETLRNLRSGTSLGASQVTAIVRRIRNTTPTRIQYPVVARARLAYPYLVRLTRAVPVPDSCRLDRAGLAAFESAMESLLRLRKQDSDGLLSIEEAMHFVA